MTTTSRRRLEPGEPGDESGSPREDRGRDGLHRGNRASDRDRAGRGGRPSSLLKRCETPGEVGAVGAFVASDHARVINGAAARADGGVVRSIF